MKSCSKMNKALRIAYFKELARSQQRCMSSSTSSFQDVVNDWSKSISTMSNHVRKTASVHPHEVPISNEVELKGHLSQVEKIAQKSASRILSLFERYGNSDYTIGEPMTITEHSVQTAYAARDKGENEETQLSCLLHDIGHLCGLEANREPGMDGCGTEDHERVGAEFLESLGFSPVVSYLALHHVNAKRYLCAVNSDYAESLTPASQTTMKHQGGPMSKDEIEEVEKDPRWPLVLRMRSYDEAGKQPDQDVSSFLRSYESALLSNLRESVSKQIYEEDKCTTVSQFAHSYVVSEEQLHSYEENGFLIVRNAFSNEEIKKLPKMAKELEKITEDSETRGGRLVHYERNADGERRVCRVENFVKPCEVWGSDSYIGVVEDIVSQVYGEKAVLFKDKINFKGPKCAGFLAHQDATAFVTDELANHHISVMVAVDHASPRTGALEVARGCHKQGILMNDAGVIDPEVEDTMEFETVNVSPGDLVLFDSYLPHRSGPNTSSTEWRRAAYLTFNKLSDGGDCHSSYYKAKDDAMKNGTAGSISVNKDFGGDVID
jgi:2-aminoethylphosphonate dioxygenase